MFFSSRQRWLNDFFPEDTPGFSSNSNGTSLFVFGDLVTMTIYDIFETDETGRLLSYAPTFDNKSVTKTSHTSETIRKQSNKMKTRINNVANSRAITEANKGLMLVSLFVPSFHSKIGCSITSLF